MKVKTFRHHLHKIKCNFVWDVVGYILTGLQIYVYIDWYGENVSVNECNTYMSVDIVVWVSLFVNGACLYLNMIYSVWHVRKRNLRSLK